MDPVWQQVHTDYHFAKKKLAHPVSLVGMVVVVLGFFGVWAAQFAVNLNQDIRQQAQETSYGSRSSSGGQSSTQTTQVIEVGADGVTWENQDAATKANFIATFGSEEEARKHWNDERAAYLAQQAGVANATSIDGFSNTNVTKHVYIAGFGWVLPEKAIEFFGDKASTCGVNSAGGVCCPASACSERTVSLASWGTLQPTGSGQVYNCIEGDAGCLRRELAEQQSRGGQIQVTMGSQGELKKTFTSAEELAKAIPADQRTATENDAIRREAERDRHVYEAQQLATKIETALKTITESNVVSLLKAEEAYKEYCREGQTGDVAQACRELRAGIQEAQELSKKNGELLLQELQAITAQANRALANCIGTNCEKVLAEFQQEQREILAECKSTILCNQIKDRAQQFQNTFSQKYSQVTTVQTLMTLADGYVEAFVSSHTSCTSLASCTNNLFEVKSQLDALVVKCEQQPGQNCDVVKAYIEDRKLLVDAELQNAIDDNLSFTPYQDIDAAQTDRVTASNRVINATRDLLANEVPIAQAAQVYEDYCRSGGGGGGYSGGRPRECTSLKTAIDSYEDATTLVAELDNEESLVEVDNLRQETTRIYLEDVATKLENNAISAYEANTAYETYCSPDNFTHQCVNLGTLLPDYAPVETATRELRDGQIQIADAEKILAENCSQETQVDTSCDGLRLVISTVRGEQEYNAEQARLAEEAKEEDRNIPEQIWDGFSDGVNWAWDGIKSIGYFLTP